MLILPLEQAKRAEKSLFVEQANAMYFHPIITHILVSIVAGLPKTSFYDFQPSYSTV